MHALHTYAHGIQVITYNSQWLWPRWSIHWRKMVERKEDAHQLSWDSPTASMHSKLQ